MKTVYVFDSNWLCVERNATNPMPPVSAFKNNHGENIYLHIFENDPAPGVPINYVRAILEGGAITGIAVDPAWAPPEPPDDPLEELHQALSKNNLTSVHDKKWADQKEYLKEWGIPWIKAHPACTQAEAVAALEAELANEFPGQARVISIAGVLQSSPASASTPGRPCAAARD